MIVMAVVLLLQSDPDALISGAASRLSVVKDAPAPKPDYRIDGHDRAAPSAKDRALSEDGQRCSVVGSRVCTRPPRTLLSAPIANPR